MSRLISSITIATLLALFFASCNLKDKEPERFFSGIEERDTRILGTWKDALSQEKIIEVVSFHRYGAFMSSMDPTYHRYYTEGGKIYFLRRGKTGTVDTYVYQIQGDRLTITDTRNPKSSRVYTKL